MMMPENYLSRFTLSALVVFVLVAVVVVVRPVRASLKTAKPRENSAEPRRARPQVVESSCRRRRRYCRISFTWWCVEKKSSSYLRSCSRRRTQSRCPCVAQPFLCAHLSTGKKLLPLFCSRRTVRLGWRHNGTGGSGSSNNSQRQTASAEFRPHE